MDGVFARIYAAVRRIPRGRVTSYGDIARQAGLHQGARTVGWALASLPPQTAVPWWRVVRADGTIAPRPGAGRQRRHLVREGVQVRRDGRVDVARYGWAGRMRDAAPRRQARTASAAAPQTAAPTRTATRAPAAWASAPMTRPPSGAVPKNARM